MSKKFVSALIATAIGALATSAHAQWTVAGTRIYYNAGNVGIGTTNPAYPLDVRTTALRAIFANNTAATGTTYAVFGQSSSTAGRALFGFANAGNGTTYGMFGQANSTAGRGVYGFAQATTGTNYGVFGRSNSRNGYGVHGWNAATAGNAVGVFGKTSSAAGTGVYGEAVGGTGIHGVATSGIAVSGHVSSATAHSAYFTGGRNYFEGRVGIGTDAPLEALDVRGNLMIRSNDRLYFGEPNESTDPIFFIREPNGTNSTLFTLVLGNDPADNNFADWFVISTRNSNGTANNDRFYFSSFGAAYKPGGGAWTTLSDARAKRDITPLDNSLDTLLKLRGVTFYYNDPSEMGAIAGKRTGFIAQEVEQVIPEWVGEARGRKSLDISGFEALAVEALRELRTEKDAQIAALRAEKDAEIDGLRHRLERLEALLGSGSEQASGR